MNTPPLDGVHGGAVLAASEALDLQQQFDALNRHMRAVFELAPVAIWITDGDYIVFANRACADLFGAASQALVGRSIYALLAPLSQASVRHTVAQALHGHARADREREDRPARRELREVEIASPALPDHGRTVVQMVITDITQRQRQARWSAATARNCAACRPAWWRRARRSAAASRASCTTNWASG